MRTPPHPPRARSGGFTLIELVIVLIIIGVLAAVAVPRFVDFTDEADEASVQSQAANITAANTINVGACRLKGTGDAECAAIDGACSASNVNSILGSDLDGDIFAVSGGGSPGTQWESSTCTLESNNSNEEADFQLTQTTE